MNLQLQVLVVKGDYFSSEEKFRFAIEDYEDPALSILYPELLIGRIVDEVQFFWFQDNQFHFGSF